MNYRIHPFYSVLIVLSVCLPFWGCPFVNFNEPYYNPHETVRIQSVDWTIDGSSIVALVDSTTSQGSRYSLIRRYDLNGTVLMSMKLPNYGYYYYNARIFAGRTTNIAYYQAGNDNYSYNSTAEFNLASGVSTPIAGGKMMAMSSDRTQLLLSDPLNTNNGISPFLLVNVSTGSPRLEASYPDQQPYSYSGAYDHSAVFLGSSAIGYLHYNSFYLLDFIIRDTSGVLLDSTGARSFESSTSVFYAPPGVLYFISSQGIVQYDSAARQFKNLNSDYIYGGDVAPNGSFIAYITSNSNGSSSGVMLLNPKSMATMRLLDYTYRLKISPASDKLVYVDSRDNYYDKLTVIPVSAP